MILVDNQIHEKIQECGMIENYDKNNLGNIVYDLTSEKFIEHTGDKNQENTSFTLQPHQSTIVATKELINLPNNIIAKIVGKNSRIREGLLVDAPVYQPGHHTRIYFRLTNISPNTIYLNSGHSYASVMFEKLETSPDKPYNGTFQNEMDYTYLADYTTQYQNEIHAVEDKLNNLKNFEKTIYGNVITILTIFIAIFSIINVNIELVSQNTQNFSGLLLFNLCTVGSISLLSNIIMYNLFSKTFKKILWLIPILCFIGAFICFFMR